MNEESYSSGRQQVSQAPCFRNTAFSTYQFRVDELIFDRGQNSPGLRVRWHQIFIALKDPKLYLGSLMVGAQGVGIGAFAVFLPTFMKEFGFSALDTQLYSIIPYAFGLVGLVSVSFLFDRVNHKAWITFGCLCTAIVGLIILLATTNKVALVARACFVSAGAYPGLVVSVAWLLTFHGGYTKRATAAWFNQIFI